jgi:hypothetical protein
MTTIQSKTEAAIARIAADNGFEAVFHHDWPNTGQVHFQPEGSFRTVLTVSFQFAGQSSFKCSEPLWPARPGTRDGSNANMFLVTSQNVSDLDYVIGQIGEYLAGQRAAVRA